MEAPTYVSGWSWMRDSSSDQTSSALERLTLIRTRPMIPGDPRLAPFFPSSVCRHLDLGRVRAARAGVPQRTRDEVLQATQALPVVIGDAHVCERGIRTDELRREDHASSGRVRVLRQIAERSDDVPCAQALGRVVQEHERMEPRVPVARLSSSSSSRSWSRLLTRAGRRRAPLWHSMVGGFANRHQGRLLPWSTYGCGMRGLREEAVLRQGGDLLPQAEQPALEPEHPEGSGPRRRYAAPSARLHVVHQGGQGHAHPASAPRKRHVATGDPPAAIDHS